MRIWKGRDPTPLVRAGAGLLAALSISFAISGCVDDPVCEDLTRPMALEANTWPEDLVTDIDSNTYVVGTLYNFDVQRAGDARQVGGSLTAYDPAGAVRWTQQVTAYQNDEMWMNSVATGPNGDLFVLGEYVDPYDGDGGAFIGRYGTDGTERGFLFLEHYADKLAIDPSGNLYVLSMTSTDHWGPSPVGGLDVLVAKYSPDGARQWLRLLGSTEDDRAYAIATDANGSVYVTGDTEGVFDQPGATTWDDDGFVAKFNTSGSLRWVRQLETSGRDTTRDVTVDNDGNVFIAGYTYAPIDDQEYRGHADSYVRKYDSAGAVLWTRMFGTPMTDFAWHIEADAGGSVYISGWTDGAIDGGQWPQSFDDTISMGGSDGFLTTFDAAGNRGHTMQFGTPMNDSVVGVSVGYDGNVYTLNPAEQLLYGFNPRACAP